MEHCEDCRRGFLKGFFDSEGTVDKNGSILCFNSDKKLLSYVKRLLSNLGIEATGPHLYTKRGATIFDKKRSKTYRARNDAYRLYVRARGRLRFHQFIGFTIGRKQRRLEEYLTRRRLLPATQPTKPSLLSSLNL